MTRAIDRWFLRYRRTGDVRLLGNVFDRAAPELWRFAAHLCADRHDAEDAVQTAFLAAIENRDDWDEERPLVPWLLGVLANRVREQRRREGRVVDAARTEARAPVPDPLAVAAQRELDARRRCRRWASPTRRRCSVTCSKGSLRSTWRTNSACRPAPCACVCTVDSNACANCCLRASARRRWRAWSCRWC